MFFGNFSGNKALETNVYIRVIISWDVLSMHSSWTGLT